MKLQQQAARRLPQGASIGANLYSHLRKIFSRWRSTRLLRNQRLARKTAIRSQDLGTFLGRYEGHGLVPVLVPTLRDQWVTTHHNL